jgi:hypothetical protein
VTISKRFNIGIVSGSTASLGQHTACTPAVAKSDAVGRFRPQANPGVAMRCAMTDRDYADFSDGIWDDGEWTSWDWINTQLDEQERHQHILPEELGHRLAEQPLASVKCIGDAVHWR